MVDLNQLWEERIKVWGFALAVSGALWIILDQVIPQEYSMKRGHLLILVFASITLIVATHIQGVMDRSKSSTAVPKIVKYKVSEYMSSGVFITKPSPLLNQNLLYAIIFEEDGGFERVIGAAKFVMAQNNGLVQLMVISRNAASSEIWKRLDAGEKDQVDRVRIKMGMPEK